MRLKLVRRGNPSRAVWAVASEGGKCQPVEDIDASRPADLAAAYAAFRAFAEQAADYRDIGNFNHFRDGACRWRFGDLRVGFFVDGGDVVIVAAAWQKDRQRERPERIELILARKKRYFKEKAANQLTWDSGDGHGS